MFGIPGLKKKYHEKSTSLFEAPSRLIFKEKVWRSKRKQKEVNKSK